MELREKLKDLPSGPGVYIYYDAGGSVLYVGKAKVLKNRIRQYFQSGGTKNEKVAAMLTHVVDLKYILTPSEADAFALENNLIKKYMPPYNILLKDDKQYQYVKITQKEEFPRVTVVRKIGKKDGAKYFGPIFGNGQDLIELLADIYPIALCAHNFSRLPKNFRPCLNYHIGRCGAPCRGYVTTEAYRENLEGVKDVLSGEDKRAREMLTKKMLEASEAMDYEKALAARRRIEALERMSQSRIAALPRNVDYDVFTIADNGKSAVINHLVVRAGKIMLSDNIHAADAAIDADQTLSSYLVMYANGGNGICNDVLLQSLPEDAEQLAEMLSGKCERRVHFSVPTRGDRKKLVEMSAQNALEYLTKSQNLLERQYAATIGACGDLKTALELKSFPQRMECYDISNISGADKVASMVVFTNGKPDKAAYRRFKIQTVEGSDDFASMREVISRRLLRLAEGDTQFGEKPDLIVVDGGLGQLSSAKDALDAAARSDIELISLAKREEIVYTPQNHAGVRLAAASAAKNLLVNLRDEAHRFAITYFRSLHTKNGLKSELERIKGVGKKRLLALVRQFKSIENIKKASLEELCAVQGMSLPAAEEIIKYFN